MNIHQLYQQLGQEIVDYNTLMSALHDYARPREKLSSWLRTGALLRVKKGLYVFGEAIRNKPVSHYRLANLIYGPSAISMQSALSFYGLIPEKVVATTSITNKRNKQFNTPLGVFNYRYLNPNKYALGVSLIESKNQGGVLMATPEKALCDMVTLVEKNLSLKNTQEFEDYLLANLRLDVSQLHTLNDELLQSLVTTYKNRQLNNFYTYLIQWKQSHA